MQNVKKALLSLFVFSAAAYANADQTATIEATDAYSQLCKAALVSEQAFVAKARELKISKNERDRLVCNDLSVEEFAANFELTETNNIATVQ